MLKRILLPLLLIAFTATYAQKKYEYPIAPKDSTVNVYFDSTIYDPYQWMENPTDPRLLTWIEAQKKITKKQENRQFNKGSLGSQILSMYWDTKEESIDDKDYKEEKVKKKYEFKFVYKEFNRVPDLLYKKKGESNFRTLVKIKDFRKTKDDNVIITYTTVNNDQDLIAVGMSHNGSDWIDSYIFDLKSGQRLPDTLNFLRITSQVIWDQKGIYYDRYKKPKVGREHLDKAKGQTLYYHKIGTSQSSDLILYQNPDTTGTYDFSFFKKDSSKLFFHHYYKSKGKIFKAISYATIGKDASFLLKNFILYPNSDSISFNIEVLIGDTVFMRTTWNSPNGRVVRANIKQFNKIEEIVPEYDSPLNSVNLLGKDKITCIYRNNGVYLVFIRDFKGKLLKKIEFPMGKKVDYFYENNSNVEFTDFCVSSFYHPDIWFKLSLKDLTYEPSIKLSVPYDVDKLETRYIKYISKDGTEIPMYITCLKDIELKGKIPTLLYGYGGYGITIEPNFNESTALWLTHGGVLAIPDIRGGGVEDSNWAKDGRGLKKQNTIDDFIAAAEYLIKENYTNPEKLALSGGSHGGLLVGAVISQRPELFKAAIAEAGVFDMLRFEKYTIGSTYTNIKEFGSVNNYEDFINLKSYSPLHNIKKGVEYPNVLLITGDADDRVPPFHSYKFLATLQERASSKSLCQLYIVPGAGHGGALTPDDWLDKTLFQYYFLFDQLDLKF